MALYRARPGDGVAWITGASSGIGRRLALDLARAGYVVAASARSEDKLVELEQEAASAGGRVVGFACDVTDAAAIERTVTAIERDVGPIALAIFNAGNYFPTRGERLEADNFVRTYEINVFGVIYGMVAAVERMKTRRRGHIAIVGSVTAYGGLPLASAYGASKAALNNMAAALKFDFDKMNIRIQMFNPGFIDTPLTKNNKFHMPALMKVEDASARIAQGLASGGFEVSFPRRFTWMLKIVNLLPYRLYFPIMNRAMGWDKRPLRM